MYILRILYELTRQNADTKYKCFTLAYTTAHAYVKVPVTNKTYYGYVHDG